MNFVHVMNEREKNDNCLLIENYFWYKLNRLDKIKFKKKKSFFFHLDKVGENKINFKGICRS